MLQLANARSRAYLYSAAPYLRDSGSNLAEGVSEYRFTTATPAKMIAIAPVSRHPNGSR